MKILVIFTGGTIGSTVKDGWISTDNTAKYTLIENYKNSFGDSVCFDTCEPYFMLSENLSAKHLNLLTESVKEALSKDFDGIIITHGTDTLHFSAAAIHLAFSGADIPIVFVSANYPLENALSNGHANFEAAVKLIQSGISSGVYISYKNPDGKHFIHYANKAFSFSECDDSIYSLHREPFAIYENGSIKVMNKGLCTSCNKTVFCNEPKILTITAAPADDFEYNIDNKNAVILRPYHSGTLNSQNDKLKAFLKTAAKKEVPVFLVNAPFGITYETAKEYSALELIVLPDTTFPYVYMKLWAAISENKNLQNLF